MAISPFVTKGEVGKDPDPRFEYFFDDEKKKWVIADYWHQIDPQLYRVVDQFDCEIYAERITGRLNRDFTEGRLDHRKFPIRIRTERSLLKRQREANKKGESVEQ